MSTSRFSVGALVATTVLCAMGVPAHAQVSRFDLGVRAVMLGMDGEPANDAPGYGLFGRYRLSGNWSVGLAVDSFEYDFERPYLLLGLEVPAGASEGEVDATTEALMLAVLLERAYPSSSGRREWFWGVGAGAASVDVDDVVGTLADGSPSHITTDAGTEAVLIGTGGVRFFLSRIWAVEGALRTEYHIADWTVRDLVSGASGSIGSYTAWGGQLGFLARF